MKKTKKAPSFFGARHGELRSSSAVRNVFKGILTGVLVLGLSGVGVAAYAWWDMAGRLETVSLANGPDGQARIDGSAIDGDFAIALVGSDTRDGQESVQDDNEGELNDVNLVLYVDEAHKNATVISVPRDLMVPTPTCPGPNGEADYYPAASERQINSTLETGGLACVVRTLQDLLDLEIEFAGEVTFDGVINMSNAIGGVDVCLTEPIVDPKADLDLPAGDVTLVGTDALQFLRTRHGVGDGSDQSRISNQQVFMAAMMRKLKSADTLGDPTKVFRLAKATVENVKLSDSLVQIDVLQSLAFAVKDLDLENINFVQYPTFKHQYDTNRLTPDWAAAEELMDFVRTGQAFEVGTLGEGVYEAGGENAEPGAEGETSDADAPESGEGETSLEGETTDPANGGKAKVNDNISGQNAAQVTCSQGRTQW
ncbi:LCP family protein [Leucobacter chinensis]|uniref:LCP family protein n=1 Tax=Leucobacter chinensis TaxID=2851010 RepID=UPI001C248259|nr:LCP family protein [Leucobacter chinensis]